MLTELDALNDEDEQSEKFENMELLGVCLPSSIIKFMTTDSSTVIILIMHSPAPSFSYALWGLMHHCMCDTVWQASTNRKMWQPNS